LLSNETISTAFPSIACEPGLSARESSWMLVPNTRDFGTEEIAAKLALRVVLLQESTLLGLRSAAAEPSLEGPGEWQDWVDWAATVTTRFDEMISRPLQSVDGAPPGRRRIRQLTRLLDELTVRPERGPENTLRSRYSDWLELLENLAMVSRWVESFGLIPMDESAVDGPGVDLLGTVQDSLIVLTYGDDDDAELSAGSIEVHRLLQAARAAGGWEPFDRESPARPSTASGQHSGIADWREEWREILDFLRCVSAAPALYRRLDPGGRELTAWERDEILLSLRTGAVAMRKLARIAPTARLPTAKGYPNIDLRTATAVLRKVQRSLILALSDQEDRRAEGMSAAELLDPECAARVPRLHSLTDSPSMTQ
jgi:hypothetical protein